MAKKIRMAVIGILAMAGLVLLMGKESYEVFSDYEGEV